MMRWLGYVIGCFIAGVIALNLYFFAAIASWQWLDPSSSAFMRAERMRLCGANVFTCRIDHRWVNYDQISRNLKRAVIASEDADFVSHSGWEVDAMLDAWEK
ncbi:transglycosylase domain-containing protein, partial [uncultured Ralstonia sp.]